MLINEDVRFEREVLCANNSILVPLFCRVNSIIVYRQNYHDKNAKNFDKNNFKDLAKPIPPNITHLIDFHNLIIFKIEITMHMFGFEIEISTDPEINNIKISN